MLPEEKYAIFGPACILPFFWRIVSFYFSIYTKDSRTLFQWLHGYIWHRNENVDRMTTKSLNDCTIGCHREDFLF